MTAEEQIVKMTVAIRQAIKVMENRFGSTETDVTQAVDALKGSIQIDGGKPSLAS
jgi:hypothetical protein